MKNITQIILYTLFSMLSIYLSSCNKSNHIIETEPINIDLKKPVILEEDGRLVFQSYNHLENTVFHLNERSEKVVLPENFISVFDAYHNLTEHEILEISQKKSTIGYEDFLVIRDVDGELEADMVVDDPILARLVSRTGEIQIGDHVYKITAEKTFKTKVQDYDFVQRNNWNVDLPKVESYEIVRKVSEQKAEIDNCAKYYWKNNRKRLKGEMWHTDAVVWESLGARTKHQKKVIGIWWRNKTQQLRLRLNGSVAVVIVNPQTGQQIIQQEVQVNYDSGWQDDDGREAYVAAVCENLPTCEFLPGSMQGTHECINDDGDELICYTNN